MDKSGGFGGGVTSRLQTFIPHLSARLSSALTPKTLAFTAKLQLYGVIRNTEILVNSDKSKGSVPPLKNKMARLNTEPNVEFLDQGQNMVMRRSLQNMNKRPQNGVRMFLCLPQMKVK